jgi:hypothetical protein
MRTGRRSTTWELGSKLLGAKAGLLHQIPINALGTQAHLDLSGTHLSQPFTATPPPAPVPAIEMAGFDSPFPARLPVIEMAAFGASPPSKPALGMAGFGSRKIPTNRFPIGPQLFRNPPLRRSALGQVIYRCLQAHFEDVRHAPFNRFLPSPAELFCFP